MTSISEISSFVNIPTNMSFRKHAKRLRAGRALARFWHVSTSDDQCSKVRNIRENRRRCWQISNKLLYILMKFMKPGCSVFVIFVPYWLNLSFFSQPDDTAFGPRRFLEISVTFDNCPTCQRRLWSIQARFPRIVMWNRTRTRWCPSVVHSLLSQQLLTCLWMRMRLIRNLCARTPKAPILW